MKNASLAPIVFLACIACEGVENPTHEGHNHGKPTTIVLNFTPDGGGDTLSFTWSDPEDDGDPEVDFILLPDGSDHNHHDTQRYTLDVEVWNAFEDPMVDLTPEIDDLGTEHQLFFTGSAVRGPATSDDSQAVIRHRYADEDDNGMPLGLSNTITTLDWGTADLTVTLRHMPTEDGEAVKVEGLAPDVAEDGFASIGGDNDIQVTFEIEVE